MESAAHSLQLPGASWEKPEPGFVLTDRDRDILRELHRNRFMHTHQLQALFGARVRHRLTVLAKQRYIERPAAQWVWRHREGGGSNPLVYALGNRGAHVLVGLG